MTIRAELLASTASHTSLSSVSNAGGEGKTTIALAVEAAWDLLGRPPELVDMDQGMGSLAFQRKNAKTLEWSMAESSAEDVFDVLRHRDVVFDFGANLLASGAPIVRNYNRVGEMLASTGFRRIALVPISTNKPGAVGAAKDILRAFSYMETYPVLVDRDGNNSYDEDVSQLAALTMPHLTPGLQEFRAFTQKKLGISLADAMRSPPEGWVVATDYLGMWLRAFATQKTMIGILGGDIGPVLDRLGRIDRPDLNVKLSMMGYKDGVIAEWTDFNAFITKVRRQSLWKTLDAHGLTPNGLRAAADELDAVRVH